MTLQPTPTAPPQDNSQRLWDALAAQAEKAEEARSLLIRLEGRITAMQAAMDRLSGEGLPRCAERRQRMDELERRITELASGPGSRPVCVEHRDRLHFLEKRFEELYLRLWWMATAVGGALIVQWATAVWRMMKP